MDVNKELLRERNKCTFNIRELTEYIDGGSQKTMERKERENVVVTKMKEIWRGVPERYLSHKEKYEVSVKKGVEVFKLIRQLDDQGKSNLANYRYTITSLLRNGMSSDGSPLVMHYIMFIPVILSQANEVQQALWMPRAWECQIIGSYVQTELGHGTFIRGLETTATYDPRAQEFVINSPTLTSYKWWAGGCHTANYCVLVAQLFTNGRCHGVHSFIVQVRDEETHKPLPGIKIGEIGSKMGLNAMNNGFLGFDHVRIPRTHLLMKHAQVLEDGTYVKSPNSKLNYGAMVFVRVLIVFDSVNYLSRAVTVATRYSAVRRQSQLKQSEPENQILDYMTQQHKLFIAIAASYALKIAATKLWDTFNSINEQLSIGNMERLSELHALACCLKAVSTSDTMRYVEKCRLACGGHGYMKSTNLPQLYTLVNASCTFEGDNTVLLLQTARFLVKTWRQMDTSTFTPTAAYFKLANAKDFANKWENTVDGLMRGFQCVAMRRIESCVESMKKRIQSGVSQEDAWNLTTVQLVPAAEAHCRVIILTSFYEDVQRVSSTMSTAVREVVTQLLELYAVYWALERLQDLLMFTSISKDDVNELQTWYEELLRKIRPNAIGLVDSFDILDELLQSTIGAYDGRVYERLMADAMMSPLNAEPVNQTFDKYLKPFMQGKL